MCICVFFLFTLHLEEGDIERRFKKKKWKKKRKRELKHKRGGFTRHVRTQQEPPK